MDATNLPSLFGLSELPHGSYEFGGKAYTTQELWIKIAEKINVLIEHFNYLDKNFTSSEKAINLKLDYLLGEGLNLEVSKKLISMVSDGTLATIINQELFTGLDTKITKVEETAGLNLANAVQNLNNSLTQYNLNLSKEIIANTNKITETVKVVETKADKQTITPTSAIHIMSALSVQAGQNESDDCIAIKSEDGMYHIIDTGMRNKFSFYKNMLDKFGVTKIKSLFFTHQHDDHAGNCEEFIRTYHPDIIYLRTVNFDKLPPAEITWGTKALHEKILAVTKELNIPIHEVKHGEEITLSEHEKITVLFNPEIKWDDYNYLSVAYLYHNRDKRIVFMGDLQHGSADTNIIPQLPLVDILKVAHHGIGSVVEMPIIKAIKPKISIITSDKNPIQPTCANRIISTGSTVVYNSDNNGVVSFIIDNGVIYHDCKLANIKTAYKEGSEIYVAINGADITNSVQNVKGKEYVVLQYGKCARGSFVVFDYPNYEQYAITDGTLARGAWVHYTDNHWYYLKVNGVMAVSETLWIEGQNHSFNESGHCTTKQ